jgi:hypothetical protein
MNLWVRECRDVGEPLKTFFSSALVRRMAGDIARVHPDFRVRQFTNDACRGLDALELLDRGRHIAHALGRHLPPAYPEALEVLLQSLGPEHATDELIGVGMAPFFYLRHTLFVAERGLGHFDLSMRAQYELTKRFSAEGSIRPYIAKDPERAMAFRRGPLTQTRTFVDSCRRARGFGSRGRHGSPGSIGTLSACLRSWKGSRMTGQRWYDAAWPTTSTTWVKCAQNC